LKNCPKDWFVLELSSARAEKKWTSSTSIPQTDSVLTGVLGSDSIQLKANKFSIFLSSICWVN
jgi:hypothetical protein